jgi:hypothetical protein
MTSTDLANKALSRIGEPRIDDIDDNQDSRALNIKAEYDDARQELLVDLNPEWAKKEVYLALASGESSEIWDYVYSWPADCLHPREIWNGSDTDDVIHYEIGAHSSKTSKVIKTNQVDAYLKYTADIVNLNVFSKMDINALVFLLASKIAAGITRDDTKADNMQVKYERALLKATGINKRAQKVEMPDHDGYKTARR